MLIPPRWSFVRSRPSRLCAGSAVLLAQPPARGLAHPEWVSRFSQVAALCQPGEEPARVLSVLATVLESWLASQLVPVAALRGVALPPVLVAWWVLAMS